MAFSAVSVKDLALFWRKDWQKRQMSISPKHSTWKEWVHPSKTLRSYHCLPRNQEYHTFYLNLADFVKHTLKGALLDKFHYSSFAKDIWKNYIFFPDPVNQTLLGNFVMLENRLRAVQHNVISNC